VALLLKEARADAWLASWPEALTAAHLAARWGHVSVLQLLIRHTHYRRNSSALRASSLGRRAGADGQGQLEAAEQEGESREPLKGNCWQSQPENEEAWDGSCEEYVRELLEMRSAQGRAVLDEAQLWKRIHCQELIESVLRGTVPGTMFHM
jgi:hypothetical protein